jgi:hypothetical protein
LNKAIVKKTIALKGLGVFPLRIRGKLLRYGDVRRIQRCVESHSHLGRTKISQMLCGRFGWLQPNGWLQERASRDILRRLEAMKMLKLPKPLIVPTKARHPATKSTLFTRSDFRKLILEMPRVISLELAKGNLSETAWNEIVDKFHYLGHRIVVGRCLKYLILGDDRIIGAIAFSSPAWRLKARDNLLARLGFSEHERHDKVINNSRFLITPNVRVKHLASRILSTAANTVAADWEAFYSVRPALAETFVQPSLFDGTSYLAANWRQIGLTKGYAKIGNAHHNSQEPKYLFVYGLTRKIRYKLDRLLLPGTNR